MNLKSAQNNTIKRLVLGVIIVSIMISTTVVGVKAQTLGVRSGYYFHWKGSLIITGTKVWDIDEEMEILSYEDSGEYIKVAANVSHVIFDISKEVERVRNVTVVSKEVPKAGLVDLVLFNPEYPAYGLNGLPLSVFTLFNVKNLEEVRNFVEQGLTEVPGIVYESWDIIMGTVRYVIYAELYTGKAEYVEGAIMEFIVTIDKSLGVVLNLRASWYYYGTRYVLSISLKDTNAIPKHRLTLAVTGVIVAIVVIAILVRKGVFSGKKRRVVK
ncbi:MAG: hypothetical protein ACTSX9_08310 [Candidatus Njordarchaeales archaeon]